MKEGCSGGLELADANWYVEWVNNKVLLYCIGSYIQNPMINHNEKNLYRDQSYGLCGRGRGWGDLGEWH